MLLFTAYKDEIHSVLLLLALPFFLTSFNHTPAVFFPRHSCFYLASNFFSKHGIITGEIHYCFTQVLSRIGGSIWKNIFRVISFYLSRICMGIIWWYLCDSNIRCNYYNLIAFNVLDDIAYSIIPLLWFVIAVSIRQMDLISRFRNIKVTNLNCIEH